MRIRTRLLIIIWLAVLLLTLVFIVMVFAWQSSYSRQRYLETYQQVAEGSIQQVDQSLSEMNTISLSVAYSNLIKDEFKSYIVEGSASTGMQRLKFYERNKLLSEMVFSVVGPGMSVPQVYIYGNNGGAFGNGLDNGYRNYDCRDRSWYTPALEQNGLRYVSAPERPAHIASINPLEQDRDYVSLVRVFFDPLNLRQGFVEVMQRAETLFSPLVNRESDGGSYQAVFIPASGYIYQEEGFPAAEGLMDLYTPEAAGSWVYDKASGNHLLFLASAQSDYVLVATVPQSGLVAENLQLVRLLALASVIALLLLTPVVLSLAKTVSDPINRLYHSIRAVNLESIQEAEPVPLDSNIVEIQELDRAFRRMRRKISDSLQRILLVEKHETQARMLALQAQTNPHFLYNTFATIAAMASAGMDNEIESMCEDISSLLRYISSDTEEMVSVQKELDITEKYIACMQARFPHLGYAAHVPANILQRRLPKLAVQLLVENAVKFVGRQKPPWTVEVTGRSEADGFSLTVSDNGPGFDAETLETLREKMEEIHRTGILPSLELEGMGLLNLFIRMDMMYQDRILFTLENRPEGGAAVTIGFKSTQEEEEGYAEG